MTKIKINPIPFNSEDMTIRDLKKCADHMRGMIDILDSDLSHSIKEEAIMKYLKNYVKLLRTPS